MSAVARALLLVDVIKDFEHEDGDRLLADFRAHHDALVRTLAEARAEGRPVVYANDGTEDGESDPEALVRRALAGKGADLVRDLTPAAGDEFVVKPGYSGFHGTDLDERLRSHGAAKVDVAGTATEMCVFQTVTDGLRLGFELTVLAGACASVDERHAALSLAYLEDVLGVRVRR
jgi:nicotinamidase-related amidase